MGHVRRVMKPRVIRCYRRPGVLQVAAWIVAGIAALALLVELFRWMGKP